VARPGRGARARCDRRRPAARRPADVARRPRRRRRTARAARPGPRRSRSASRSSRCSRRGTDPRRCCCIDDVNAELDEQRRRSFLADAGGDARRRRSSPGPSRRLDSTGRGAWRGAASRRTRRGVGRIAGRERRSTSRWRADEARERDVAHFVRGGVPPRRAGARGAACRRRCCSWPTGRRRGRGAVLAPRSASSTGTLMVEVPDPETALHLGMQRHHVLARVRRAAGEGTPCREHAVPRRALDRSRPRRRPSGLTSPSIRSAVAALARDLGRARRRRRRTRHAAPVKRPAHAAGPAARRGLASLPRLLHALRDREPREGPAAIAGRPRGARHDDRRPALVLDVPLAMRGTPKVQRLALRLCLRPRRCDCGILSGRRARGGARGWRWRGSRASARSNLLPQALGDPGLRPPARLELRAVGLPEGRWATRRSAT
jgi:hypothetical protein